MTEGSHGSNPIPGLAVAITAKDSHRTITRTAIGRSRGRSTA